MLEFQNITVKEKDRILLDDLSLSIPEGVIMGLAGSDDRARSCLLAVAGGVLQPDLGQVLLADEPVQNGDRYGDTYEMIGYMPGRYGFYDQLSVEEYYEFFLSLNRVNPRYWERRMGEILHLTGLTEYTGVEIRKIPSDQLPLLFLGKTLLHDPDWLLLDDPFFGLNVSGRDQMIRVLLTLQEAGKSILIQSRLFPELMDFYTDIAVIENGRVVESGLIQDVFEMAMKESPVRMHLIAGMEEALQVLKDNPLVERVTVNEMDVIFRFNGGAREEAVLLSDLVSAGSLIQNYVRNQANIEQIIQGGKG